MTGQSGKMDENAQDPRFGFHIVCERPLTILTATRVNATALVEALEACGANAPIVFVMTWWSVLLENSEQKQLAKQFSRCFPNGKIYFLANDDQECAYLCALGLPSLLINHNCFVDESIFKPIGSAIQFEAVYNAAFHGYKRHYLAREISSLLLIGYSFRGHSENSQDILNSLPAATVANPRNGAEFLPMPAQEVSSWLCKASVALCLSAVEGAMYASMEYLLSGLPVVSTLSLGGRDYFFEDDFVRIVDPAPMAIKSAARDLARNTIDPCQIRSRVLSKVRVHRARFASLLFDLDVVLDDFDPSRQWSDRFRHTLLTWSSRAEFVPSITAMLGRPS